MKQRLTKLKAKIHNLVIIADFNTSLSVMDRILEDQQENRKLENSINQLDLTDI